jgi:broad-specificity NMP kinase
LEEVTKFLLTQGVLGVWAVAATAGVVWLFRANQILWERLTTKGDTDKKVNDGRADRLEGLVVALLEQARKRGGRRPTGLGIKAVDND